MLDKSTNIEISKHLVFILRHNPSLFRIQLDKDGWASLDEIIKILSKHKKTVISISDVKVIVNSFSNGILEIKNGKIRAKNGHSIILNMEIPEGFKETKVNQKLLYVKINKCELSNIINSGLKLSNLKSEFNTQHFNDIYDEQTEITIEVDKAQKSGTKFYYNEINKTYISPFVKQQFLKIKI